MASVRRWADGQLIVTGDTQNGTALAFTPDEALALARDLRNAADPWGVDACIEWLKENWHTTVEWLGDGVHCVCIGLEFRYSHNWPDTRTGLRECVHDVAEKRGLPCPLGDLCAICHPPSPPVPTDEELAAMGTEELIEWVEDNGRTAEFRRIGEARPPFSRWAAYSCDERYCSITADTLVGLAQKVAEQLREAKRDE